MVTLDIFFSHFTLASFKKGVSINYLSTSAIADTGNMRGYIKAIKRMTSIVA